MRALTKLPPGTAELSGRRTAAGSGAKAGPVRSGKPRTAATPISARNVSLAMTRLAEPFWATVPESATIRAEIRSRRGTLALACLAARSWLTSRAALVKVNIHPDRRRGGNPVAQPG
jgi:hypothetical protein